MSKIFGTDGIRCLVNEEPLSAETCLKISKTVAFLLKKKNSKNSRVVICKDTRLSGYLYEPLVTAGFISMGMDVILVGPLPTPAVPLMIKTLRADIGVMITASHNTYEYNGLKFFDGTGTKLSSLIENEPVHTSGCVNCVLRQLCCVKIKKGKYKEIEKKTKQFEKDMKRK